MCTKQCPYNPAICCTEPECPVDACEYLREYIENLKDKIEDLEEEAQELRTKLAEK